MNITFKPVEKYDIQFLYDLFLERTKYPKEIRFKSEEIPSYKEHEKFVKNHLIGNGYQSWHVIILDDEKVGAICLKKDGEWVYHVLMRHWRKGIGQSALKWLTEQNSDKILIARIKPSNTRAKHIAEKFGHQVDHITYIRYSAKNQNMNMTGEN